MQRPLTTRFEATLLTIVLMGAQEMTVSLGWVAPLWALNLPGRWAELHWTKLRARLARLRQFDDWGWARHSRWTRRYAAGTNAGEPNAAPVADADDSIARDVAERLGDVARRHAFSDHRLKGCDALRRPDCGRVRGAGHQ